MKVGIMQPYFFPYIGYFQLIKAVDKFVLYDDVTFIKQGWINRNKILLNDKEFLINLILDGASSFKLINQTHVGKANKKLLKTIDLAYRKSPFFPDCYPIINDILLSEETVLSIFLENSIRKITSYLGIETEIVVSSNIVKDINKKGEERIIDICKCLKADTYINAIGGQALYNKEKFRNNNIELKFIQTQPIEYKQYQNEFIPWLSIIDIMMFNSKEVINQQLDKYTLI